MLMRCILRLALHCQTTGSLSGLSLWAFLFAASLAEDTFLTGSNQNFKVDHFDIVDAYCYSFWPLEVITSIHVAQAKRIVLARGI